MDPRQARPRIEKIRIDTLQTPPAGKAQRPFRKAKGDKIAREFDINSFGFPVVCQVEDTNWVVDGQHRVYGIQKSGYAQPGDSIECEVYEGLSIEEMARMFLGRNQSTPVTGFERFRVALTAGSEQETAINKIVEELGLKVGWPKITGNIYAVGSLRRVYERDGAEKLQQVLRVLRDAYERSAGGFGRQMIDGLGLVLSTYRGIDEKLLVRALAAQQHGVHSVQRRAEEYRERLGRQLPQCTAASMVDIYNRHAGKKRRLMKWWKAHEGGRLRRGRKLEFE